MNRIRSTIAGSIFLSATAIGAAGPPSATALTYQGVLQQSGSPAEGTFDVAFSLWDAETDGNQIGATITFIGLEIAGGLVNAELDFGANAFDNTGRWLEIMVDSTTLSPRQRITRSPYSIQTRGIFVDENSNVGIGTTTPQDPLHVFGPDNDGTNAALRVESGGQTMLLDGNEIDAVGTLHVQHNSSGNVLLTNGGGSVGIAVAIPNARLHAASSVTAILGAHEGPNLAGTGVLGRTNSATFAQGVTGQATATSGNSVAVLGNCSSPTGHDFLAFGPGIDYGSTSSIRWKRNIERIENPLSTLAQLRGVYFDWDEEHGGHHDIGMIAEEVGAVLPEIVSYEANGIDAVGMDYSKLTALLVEAVNALRTENDAVRAENEALRTRLIYMESRLDEIETAISSDRR